MIKHKKTSHQSSKTHLYLTNVCFIMQIDNFRGFFFLKICAHRWKDNYLNIHLNGISHMNGICYQLNSSLSQSARKIPALTIRERLVNRQRYAEFSMGGLGMSAMFSGVGSTHHKRCTCM